MRLKDISIRVLVNGTVIILSLLVVVLVGILGRGAYQRYVESKRLASMNEMADLIIDASVHEALERGITATALVGGGSAGSDTLEKIRELRTRGDESLNKALEIAGRMAAGGSDSRFVALYEKVGQAYKVLLEARKRVDGSLRGGGDEIGSDEWFRVMTEVIDRARDLRQSAFISHGVLQEVVQDNLLLKEAIWLVSEYIGRERGTLGPIIASQLPVPAGVMENLKVFRARVEIGLRDILSLKESREGDPRIVRAIDEMERALKRFEETRMEVYSGSATGRYPISPREWIRYSTEAIDKVVAVSTAVTEVDNEKAGLVASKGFWNLLLLLSLALGILLSLGVVLTLIYDKTRRINTLYESINRLAIGEGDLTFRLDGTSGDEIGRIEAALNSFLDQLQRIVVQIRAVGDRVASEATTLAAMAEQLARSSNDQTHQCIQVATAIEEMSRSVAEVARNGSTMTEFSQSAREKADMGGKVVHETADRMEKIARSVRDAAVVMETLSISSKKIGDIVSVIDNIAEQTNLLALNAAIEAARANEHGKGFAVVADEVKKLAEKTTKATSQIASMIKTVQSEIDKAVAAINEGTCEVEEGVFLARETERALGEIVEGSQKIMEMITQIAAATEEQSSVSCEIAGNVEKISEFSKEKDQAISQTAATAKDLQKYAAHLQQTVGWFKV